MLPTGKVARMLGVFQNTVREYVQRGLLPCLSMDIRTVRKCEQIEDIVFAALEKLIQST